METLILPPALEFVIFVVKRGGITVKAGAYLRWVVVVASYQSSRYPNPGD